MTEAPTRPPDEVDRVADGDALGRRILEREDSDTECPQCRHDLEILTVSTGDLLVHRWTTGETIKHTQTVSATNLEQRCPRCGWGVTLA